MADDGQDYGRGMVPIVEDALLGRKRLDSLTERIASVGIAVILGEGGGSDLNGDAMARLEDVRCVPAVDDVVIHLPWLDQCRTSHSLTKTRPHHAVAEALSEPGGPDIKQHGCEVRIACRGGAVELHTNGTGYLGSRS